MYTLQKLMTHSGPAMTQRYAHLHDEALKRGAGVAMAVMIPHAAESQPEAVADAQDPEAAGQDAGSLDNEKS